MTSKLAARVRDQAEAAKHCQARTATLYALSRQIAGAAELADVLCVIVTHVAQILSAKVVILLPDTGQPALMAGCPAEIVPTEAERAAATWTWQHQQPSGQGTDTLPGTGWFYLPLSNAHGTLGVLGLQLAQPGAEMSPDQRRLLGALAGQAAVAIDYVANPFGMREILARIRAALRHRLQSGARWLSC